MLVVDKLLTTNNEWNDEYFCYSRATSFSIQIDVTNNGTKIDVHINRECVKKYCLLCNYFSFVAAGAADDWQFY